MIKFLVRLLPPHTQVWLMTVILMDQALKTEENKVLVMRHTKVYPDKTERTVRMGWSIKHENTGANDE